MEWVFEFIFGIIFLVVMLEVFFGDSRLMTNVKEIIQLKIEAMKLANEEKKIELEERKEKSQNSKPSQYDGFFL